MSYHTIILRLFQRLKSQKCSLPDTDGLTFGAFSENKDNKRRQDWWLNTDVARLVPLNNDAAVTSVTPRQGRELRCFGKPQGDTEAASGGLSAVGTGSLTLDGVEGTVAMCTRLNNSASDTTRAENPSQSHPATYQLMSIVAAK